MYADRDRDAWGSELGIAGADAVILSQPSYVKAFAAVVGELPVEHWKPAFAFYGQTCAASRKTSRAGSAP